MKTGLVLQILAYAVLALWLGALASVVGALWSFGSPDFGWYVRMAATMVVSAVGVIVVGQFLCDD